MHQVVGCCCKAETCCLFWGANRCPSIYFRHCGSQPPPLPLNCQCFFPCFDVHWGEHVAWLQVSCKVIMWHMVSTTPNSVGFILPGHKADCLFDGSHILILATSSGVDVVSNFKSYLASQDTKFPLKPKLWLHADGSIPTCSWFLCFTKCYFPSRNGWPFFLPLWSHLSCYLRHPLEPYPSHGLLDVWHFWSIHLSTPVCPCCTLICGQGHPCHLLKISFPPHRLHSDFSSLVFLSLVILISQQNQHFLSTLAPHNSRNLTLFFTGLALFFMAGLCCTYLLWEQLSVWEGWLVGFKVKSLH